MKKTNLIVAAAVTGIIGAALNLSPSQALADDAAPTGKCMGANGCKAKGECKMAGHECGGKNACKGKGWTKMTEADCKKLAEKNKKIKWEKAE